MIKPRVAVNVGMTQEGLRAFGLPEVVLSTFPAEFREGIASPERSRILGDVEGNAPEFWAIGGPRSPAVHAVLFLFAKDLEALDELCQVHRQLLDESYEGGAAELAARRGADAGSGDAGDADAAHDGGPRGGGLSRHGTGRRARDTGVAAGQ